MLLGRVLFFGPAFPGWLVCPGFPGFFVCRQVFFSGWRQKTPGSMMIIRQKLLRKLGPKIGGILYTVPFYISRLLFLVGTFRSFPYMKPVFHIHMI